MVEEMEEPRWLDDTQQTAWRALSVVVGELPRLEKLFRANDMLMIQYGILAALSETPDDEMRLSELANLSNCAQSRLTHRMRLLVERGDVTTRECPDDRRVTFATLAPAGRKRVETLAPQHADDVRQLIFDHLSPEQTTALADALSTIAATLCDHAHFHPPAGAQ